MAMDTPVTHSRKATRQSTYVSLSRGCRDWSRPPAWIVYNVAIVLRRWCMALADWLAPPPLLLAEKATAYAQSQVIDTLVKLGVADALEAGPKTSEQLATELGVQQDCLHRVLRAAVNYHCLAVAPGAWGRAAHFQNNALSSLLLKDHPTHMSSFVHLVVDNGWKAWGMCPWVVETGLNGYKKANGMSLWEYLQANQEEERNFSRAMVSQDFIFCTEAAVLDYNWTRFSRVVDIAGAYGSFLARLLRRNQRAAGVLFDQPQVIDNARERWDKDADKAALRKRVTFAGGDFFKQDTLPRPEAGDVWVLRNILHDWSDADCQRILSAIRAAVGATPITLTLVEACILNEFADPYLTREFLDLHMMVTLAGRERTAAQWKTLLSGAGFKLNRIVACRAPLCVVEAVPV